MTHCEGQKEKSQFVSIREADRLIEETLNNPEIRYAPYWSGRYWLVSHKFPNTTGVCYMDGGYHTAHRVAVLKARDGGLVTAFPVMEAADVEPDPWHLVGC